VPPAIDKRARKLKKLEADFDEILQEYLRKESEQSTKTQMSFKSFVSFLVKFVVCLLFWFMIIQVIERNTQQRSTPEPESEPERVEVNEKTSSSTSVARMVTYLGGGTISVFVAQTAWSALQVGVIVVAGTNAAAGN